MNKKLTAIDLYSGIGGWSLGMHLSGVEVVASYEWWAPASRSNEVNNGHQTHLADIRKVARDEVAKRKVDIVVGSPPCTQFSFSNRGGNGDIADGFLDLAAFFEIVSQCQPTWWAMENVPRVAELLPEAIQKGRPLYKYRDLIRNAHIEVVNCADYGVPQARKRCIAGNFDMELLKSYRQKMPSRTLGDIVAALSCEMVKDPVYGFELSQDLVSDNEKESILSPEEERLNRESKVFHPVYNAMAFPECESKPARTVTATCTRVSRESLVIADSELNGFRRLTIRERGALQTFPINYQFMGASITDKMKMVGNAIPPLLTFLIGEAIQGKSAPRLARLAGAEFINRKGEKAPVYRQEVRAGKFRSNRTFRLAIPNLRFKSGMRFELKNYVEEGGMDWLISFFYGNSKDIRSSTPSLMLSRVISLGASDGLRPILANAQRRAFDLRKKTNSLHLQGVWTNAESGVHPFEVVDKLGDIAMEAMSQARSASKVEIKEKADLDAALASALGEPVLSTKLSNYALDVAIGIVVAAGFNRN